MSPFKALYCREPSVSPLYDLGTSKVQALDNLLKERDELLRTLKNYLSDSQNRMKQLGEVTSL